MRVTQGSGVFQPITIVLETEEEAEAMKAAMAYAHDMSIYGAAHKDWEEYTAGHGELTETSRPASLMYSVYYQIKNIMNKG